ncbi:MAG: hypothetical protein OEV28_09685, partial [Nitrospirota bacterium]|nr:hypothetical protein [Nitrospirota bacterium]
MLRKNKKLSYGLLALLSLVLALLAAASLFNPGAISPQPEENPSGHVSTVSTDPDQSAVNDSDEGRSLAEVYEPGRAGGASERPWYGLCAKNSINSVEDFRRTVEADPILAQHYADFDFDNARVEYLDKPMMAQVAFRKGDVIGYTKHKIMLPKGDRYITDGVRKVRTFCCNDILDGAPVSPKEPMVVELNDFPTDWTPGPGLLNELQGDQLFGDSLVGEDFAASGDEGSIGETPLPKVGSMTELDPVPTPGGSTPGGSTPGGSTPGGSTPGGSTPGG